MRVVLQRLIGSSIDFIDFDVFILKEGGMFKHQNLTDYEIIQYRHWDALVQFVQMGIPHGYLIIRFLASLGFCFLL